MEFIGHNKNRIYGCDTKDTGIVQKSVLDSLFPLPFVRLA